ncbi:Hypothetical protein CINCED_3A003047, partial [Cinara cedri]
MNVLLCQQYNQTTLDNNKIISPTTLLIMSDEKSLSESDLPKSNIPARISLDSLNYNQLPPSSLPVNIQINSTNEKHFKTPVRTSLDRYCLLWIDEYFKCHTTHVDPLLTSECLHFEFSHLLDISCDVQSDYATTLFVCTLNKLTKPDVGQVGGIAWIYNKWWKSKHILLNNFIAYNVISKYYIEDISGLFILSISMFNVMDHAEINETFLKTLDCWINSNISANIMNSPQFIRALAIAVIITCI